MSGRTLEFFSAECKPHSYAKTRDRYPAKKQQGQARITVRSEASDQECGGQEKKSVSCPAMQRHRIKHASVVNDVEWL